MAATIGKSACRNDDNSPTSTSLFISKSYRKEEHGHKGVVDESHDAHGMAMMAEEVELPDLKGKFVGPE